MSDAISIPICQRLKDESWFYVEHTKVEVCAYMHSIMES